MHEETVRKSAAADQMERRSTWVLKVKFIMNKMLPNNEQNVSEWRIKLLLK